MREPKPRKNQTCAHCGNAKNPERNGKKAPTGSRLPESFWLIELAKDPFCSRPCAEAFHGLEGINSARIVRSCEYVACGKQFVSRDGRNRFCSKQCGDKAKRKREAELRPARIEGRCAGCGGEMTGYTIGCKNCWDRRRGVRRRPRIRCSALTAEGLQCKGWAKLGSEAHLCMNHERKQVAAALEALFAQPMLVAA